jgi:hypothetical protein
MNSYVPSSMQAPVAVTGQHVPAVSLGFRPDSAGGYRIDAFGTLRDTATGHGMAGVTLHLSGACPIPWSAQQRPTKRTTSSGGFTFVLPNRGTVPCLTAMTAPNSDGVRGFILFRRYSPFVRPTVELRSPTGPVAAGRSTTLTGSAALVGSPLRCPGYNTNCHLQVQRAGRHGWVTVGDGYTRASGRFTLTVGPPAAGSYHYRISAPGEHYAYWTGWSRAITLTAH